MHTNTIPWNDRRAAYLCSEGLNVRLSSQVYLLWSVVILSCSGCADRSEELPVSSKASTRQAEAKIVDRTLFRMCDNVQQIPLGLVRAHSAFAAAAQDPTVAKLQACCLPDSVEFFETRPGDFGRGHGMDFTYMRSELYSATVESAQKVSPDCYFVRTGNAGISYVRKSSGEWKIYAYFDKSTL